MGNKIFINFFLLLATFLITLFLFKDFNSSDNQIVRTTNLAVNHSFLSKDMMFAESALTWNTFLRGGGGAWDNSITVDSDGNIYVASYTSISWGNPIRAYTAGVDVFIAKLNSNGDLIWLTFLGGNADDNDPSIVVDANGNVYVTGFSTGTWESPIRAYSSDYDAFVAKLNSNGNLVWNTFLGGNGLDFGSSVALDDFGNIHIIGISTTSWGNPIRAYTADSDAFVTKLDSNGALIWNTFLGGNNLGDIGEAIALDDIGNVYVSGSGHSGWGNPLRAYSAYNDTFIAQLDSNGSVIWNTFLGGNADDVGSSIVLDKNDNIYVTGYSSSSWGLPVRAYSNSSDAFVAKLSPTGTLNWNTFLGGSSIDFGNSIAVDGFERVYVIGDSFLSSWGNPIRAFNGGNDVFVVRLDSNGVLDWNIFLGSTLDDFGSSIFFRNGNLYLTGDSEDGWGNPIQLHTIGTNVFVAKIADYVFADVPTNGFAWSQIESIYHAGITDGCTTTPLNYCPNNSVSRAQMAVFLLRGIYGSEYTPPTATGSVFSDVSLGSFAGAWIEAFSTIGITAGCGNGNYCPNGSVTRAQMAVFLLKAKYGSNYIPPPATGTMFNDVAINGFAAAWIEQLASEGITGGCGDGNYCPNGSVTRAQMAVFLQKAFNLSLP